eukprot:5695542-Amphidinium_carterae.1
MWRDDQFGGHHKDPTIRPKISHRACGVVVSHHFLPNHSSTESDPYFTWFGRKLTRVDGCQ